VTRGERDAAVAPGRGALTGKEYWDAAWRGRRDGDRYATLGWIGRSYPYRALDRLLRSVLPVDPSRTVMELGSGPGRWLIYFHRTFGYRVFGCDYSPVSCEQARENLARSGIPATIMERDFRALEGQYDVVFSAGVVEHFEDPGGLVETFAGLVAPGGFLVTDVPNLRGLNGLYRRLLRPETFATHRVIDLADLRAWHRRAGLEVVTATSYGSVCLTRLPHDAFAGRPRIQRWLWRPLYRLASGSVNRGCLLLHGLRLRLDHPLISPHVLVVARTPGPGASPRRKGRR